MRLTTQATELNKHTTFKSVHPLSTSHHKLNYHPQPPQQQNRHHRCQTSASSNNNNKTQPQSTTTTTTDNSTIEYTDSWSDILFIGLCRTAYGNLAHWQSARSWTNGPETFKGMVEVSKSLMQGKTAEQQRDAVISGFPAVPAWFRKVFPYSKWGAELNAQITPAFFTWLVGPMKTIQVEINGEVQQSGVQIERCRYLAESNCAAMCTNLCKSPVQTFFTVELGVPLNMEPNFEDYSCKMIFGQTPPPLEEDDVSKQGCLALCSTGIQTSPKCHKL